jgi:hypothetical protein
MIQLDRTLLPKVETTRIARSEETKYGLFIALLIIAIWAGSLLFLVSLDVEKLPVYFIIPAMLLQTFLYTGLFVTAHDAMHGVVFPQNLKINNLVGSIAAWFMPFFRLRTCQKNIGNIIIIPRVNSTLIFMMANTKTFLHGIGDLRRNTGAGHDS